MESVRSLVVATFVALLSVGCGRKNPDLAYLDVSDFDSGHELRDTLAQRYPPGSHVSRVWEAMQRNGFYCGKRGVLINGEKSMIPEGRPNLECWHAKRRHLFDKRVWLVWFPFDTTTRVTTDVFAGYLGEENRRR